MLLDTTDNKFKIAEKTFQEKIIIKIITFLKSIKNKLRKNKSVATPQKDEYLNYLKNFKPNKKE